MLEKNCNVTVSDFTVYPKAKISYFNLSGKSVIRKIKNVIKHVSAYDFWVIENSIKMKLKKKHRNNRRLNIRKNTSYVLSAPDYRVFEKNLR